MSEELRKAVLLQHRVEAAIDNPETNCKLVLTDLYAAYCQALAATEQQSEPVAVIRQGEKGNIHWLTNVVEEGGLLYTRQPKHEHWIEVECPICDCKTARGYHPKHEPLSDERIDEIAEKHSYTDDYGDDYMVGTDIEDFAREIEKAVKGGGDE